MREADTFEPEDDPHDQTPIEEDLPDEADGERNICLKCGNILYIDVWDELGGRDDLYCPVCDFDLYCVGV